MADSRPSSSSDNCPSGSGQRVYDTGHVHRISQSALVENRLTAGVSPTVIAGLAAILAQMESQEQAPLLTLTITPAFPGFSRSMTYQNGVWSGHDLTHHFTDDRSSISYSPSNRGVEQNQSLRLHTLNSMPPTTPLQSRAAEPTGSRTQVPPLPSTQNRPVSEQAVMAALQAIVANPDYDDFISAITQHWPGLRDYVQPVQPNENITTQRQTTTQPRSNSPPTPSSSSQGEGERRKRNERSPQAPAMNESTTKASPTSKPPPDKKQQSTLRQPAISRLTQLKSVVSEASVLLPTPPPPAPKTIGYQGEPEKQKTIEEVLKEYPDDIPIRNSGPTGIPLRRVPKPTKIVRRPPNYLPSSTETKGTLVAKDAKRIAEVAERLDFDWYRDRQRAPPSDETQAQWKKSMISVFMNRRLRPHTHKDNEPAWLSRAINILPSVNDNYLDNLTIDLRHQWQDRYELGQGETFAINKNYARDLEAQLPVPKERIQRARYAFLIDSTFTKNVPLDNVMPDVMMITLPLSRILEMVEVLIAIFDPEMKGTTFREPPPGKVINSNVFDHMACEEMFTLLHEIEHSNPARIRGNIIESATRIATAMEKAKDALMKRLGVSVLFVTPPGFSNWPTVLQQFVHLVTEICQSRDVDFFICASNLRVDTHTLRPSWLSYQAYIASVAKVLQSIERRGNTQLTIDDAINFDHGTRMGLIMFDEEGERQTQEPTVEECDAVRQYNWLERTRSDQPKGFLKTELTATMNQMGQCPNVRKVERTLPRVQFTKDVSKDKLTLGMKTILSKIALETHQDLQERKITYAGWYEKLQTRTIADLAQELGVTVDHFVLCLGFGWCPDVIRVEFRLEEKEAAEISESIGNMGIHEIIALTLTYGQKKFIAGPWQ